MPPVGTSNQNQDEPNHGDEITQSLVDEIRAIASRQLRNERAGHSLSVSDLVNEAWIVLDKQRNLSIEQRSTYLAAAAVAIRRILVDHARARAAKKRPEGHGERVEFRSSAMAAKPKAKQQEIDVLVLEDAIEKLAASSPRAAQVVVHKFYGGMTIDEMASHLGVGKRSIVTDWQFARAWLSREMSMSELTSEEG